MDISAEDRQTLADLFETSKIDAQEKITYGDVRDYLKDVTGVKVTNQTVTNYHRAADIPEALNIPIVGGIMAFYGLTISDLPDGIADAVARATRTLVLVSGGAPSSPGWNGTSDQGYRESTCRAA